MLAKITIWHLLTLALILRLSVYLLFNSFIYEGNIQHPDSYLYHHAAILLTESWKDGIWSISRYPFYSTLIAPIYFIFGPYKVLPELFNISISVLTVLSMYYLVKNLVGIVPAKISALIITLDPYIIYLSTQLLRDTLVFAVILGSILFIVVKRFELLALCIFVLVTLRQTALTSLIPMFFLLSKWKNVFRVLLLITTLSILFTYLPYGEDYSVKTPLSPNANPTGEPHIPFYSKRSHVSNYRDLYNKPKLLFQWSNYPLAVVDYFTFPRPWNAVTKVEKAFGLHMIYIYIVSGIGILGLIGRFPRSRELLLISCYGLLLGFLLAFLIESQSGFVRWRIQVYLLTVPLLAYGVSNLLHYEIRKRVFDIVVASTILILTSPLILGLGLALTVTRRRVFFKQTRIGKDLKPFTIYKFVSMYENSDGAPVNGRNDNRITKIGKFIRSTAIDELPEIFNILKGDISIVGPRPLAVWEHDSCATNIYNWNKRYQVTPGLVGLAQIKCLRTDNIVKLKYDLEYISRRSTTLDSKIVLLGLKHILSRSGV